MAYLDNTGVGTLWSRIKTYIAGLGYTTNTGTITGITMNGASKGTSGVVDLGTVITSHQDISGKENTSNKVTSLSSSSTDTQYPSAKATYTHTETNTFTRLGLYASTSSDRSANFACAIYIKEI